MRKWRGLAAALVLAAGAVVPVAATAQSASASVGCRGAGENGLPSCSNKDPEAMGCAYDAVLGGATVMDFGAYVENWWSDACQASWGRVTNSGTTARYTVCVYSTYDYRSRCAVNVTGLAWSPMAVNRSYKDQAYAYAQLGDRQFRTAWY
ncbi:DUF2690 domain-containing protein [Microbispora sp. H10670]|uniref:DUF2690 domain-containing protein n=1 Tax=Microbispora sp. H10670 TaxID=2729108 RepID=UPI001602A564|nr:DUF2690 domain-containing protein [Microbispora sp. H10670]